MDLTITILLCFIFAVACSAHPSDAQERRSKRDVMETMKNAWNEVVRAMSNAGDAIVHVFKPTEKSVIAKVGDEFKMWWSYLLLLTLVVFSAGGEVNSIEDLDLESLLKDDVQRKAAFDCLMDKGPCGDLQKLRDSLPQLVETKCGQCTPKQKEKFDQVNKLLFSKYPKEYQDLVLKYSSKTD